MRLPIIAFVASALALLASCAGGRFVERDGASRGIPGRPAP